MQHTYVSDPYVHVGTLKCHLQPPWMLQCDPPTSQASPAPDRPHTFLTHVQPGQYNGRCSQTDHMNVKHWQVTEMENHKDQANDRDLSGNSKTAQNVMCGGTCQHELQVRGCMDPCPALRQSQGHHWEPVASERYHIRAPEVKIQRGTAPHEPQPSHERSRPTGLSYPPCQTSPCSIQRYLTHMIMLVHSNATSSPPGCNIIHPYLSSQSSSWQAPHISHTCTAWAVQWEAKSGSAHE